ncbi:magnesium transporter CorA family protein [Neobacillus drentensis]|uniref:magnesium transporter CorA family protein n=1 Tax=Neobacillus drentensis TaxID=220684 RepID=UPI001F1878C8|nr:magnesium transporter CorA family protein [Neobacillus drentensis]ULT56873.1 magnesium transporter CorA family protein [Neobacillus drentensis]
MEKYIGANKWKWLEWNSEKMNQLPPSNNEDPVMTVWLKQVGKDKANSLRVTSLANGEKVINGSLIFQQSYTDENHYKIFHFFLTTDQLITVDLEITSLDRDNLNRQLARTNNAVEGFLLFLGELMNGMLVEIDQFEETLKTLIWNVRKRNEIGILELVYTRRHELLVCKNLLIPINEVKMAIDEINFPDSKDGEFFSCTGKRIERAKVLLDEYEHELDSLINLEEVISSHRGNEIMKTLTVLTTIFTPIMALGALWGMNFKYMPELNWRYGYIFSIVMIVVSTALLYYFIKNKGWTGDLLKGKKKGSFFK